MSEVDVKEWRDFKVGDLFRIEKVYGKPINKYDDGETLYVTGSGVDNGVVGHVSAPDADISKANCISVDPIKGFACWQGTDFVGRGFSGASINLLRHDSMSEMSGLFVCSVIEAVIIGEAAYSDLFTGQRLADTVIKLPVTPDGEPDWDYMESYMRSVMDRQAQVIESLSKISKEKHPVSMKSWGGVRD